MDELEKILAVSKAKAAAGTERIAFDPMALAHAIEAGVAARVAAERERCAKLCEEQVDGYTPIAMLSRDVAWEAESMGEIQMARQCAAAIRGPQE